MSNETNHNLLKNKIILITGATRGIGQQLALTCASHGATIIALAKNKKKLEQLFDNITTLNFPEPSLVPFNLAGATPEDYKNLATLIGEQYGRLDSLIHNAATLGIKTELVHYDILKWYETIQVNLNAPFLLTQSLLPLLKLSPQASIIFTTANEAQQGQAYQGAYSVSKAGIKNLMEVFAAELETYSPNIRVNAINPNAVYSGMYTQNYPGAHPGSVPDIAKLMPLYLTLLSDYSACMHGNTLNFGEYDLSKID